MILDSAHIEWSAAHCQGHVEDEIQNMINDKHNTMTNLSQDLISYFPCMQGKLYVLTV
jgi:hypothetical protein